MHTHVHLHIQYMHKNLNLYTYIHPYVHTYLHMHIQINTHTCTHTHTDLKHLKGCRCDFFVHLQISRLCVFLKSINTHTHKPKPIANIISSTCFLCYYSMTSQTICCEKGILDSSLAHLLPCQLQRQDTLKHAQFHRFRPLDQVTDCNSQHWVFALHF